MKYKPTEVDIAWAKLMVDSLREGGVLAYPATALIFRISHRTKTLTLQNPEVLILPESEEVFKRTIVVFKKIGYRVIKRENYPEELL